MMGWISRHWSRLTSSSEPAVADKLDVSRGEGLSHAESAMSDNPIRNADEDSIGRLKSAESFANQLLALDARAGIVVGVLGPWGSGKTSFVNLARARLREAKIPVFDFNPWMFSGTEQLVGAFFVEVSAQLKLRPDLAGVGEELDQYGEAFSGMIWLPFIGPWLERGRGAAALLSTFLKRRKEGVGGRRAKVEKALSALKTPLVIVLDDIDRLTTSEIRDVFKLVRLTANFPNVVYVVAFDRERVEDALTEQKIPGRAYLEKILQWCIDLPVVPRRVLDTQLFSALDAALSRIDNPGQLNKDMWPDVFAEIVRPLINNMRDVRRYVLAAQGTVRELAGNIALVDTLALEAIRVFLPDVFRRIQSAVNGLTTPSEHRYGNQDQSAHLKNQIDDLVKAGGEHKAVVRSLIHLLFPFAQHHIGGSHHGNEWARPWLRERRVAHVSILRLYLERVVGVELQAFSESEHAWHLMTNQEAFGSYLRTIPPERLQDVISSLEVYEDEFARDHVEPGTVELLNLLPMLPKREEGFFSFGARMTVTRVVLRLLRSLEDSSAVEIVVGASLPKIKTLTAKLELITLVGYRDDAGHKLVPEETAARLEHGWRAEVRAASVSTLIAESECFRVLIIAKKDAGPTEPTINVADQPEITLSLLRSARSEARSQAMGSRAITILPRLAWQSLIELYGDEETLRQRVKSLKGWLKDRDSDLIQLADKYLSGWRPKDFGDE